MADSSVMRDTPAVGDLRRAKEWQVNEKEVFSHARHRKNENNNLFKKIMLECIIYVGPRVCVGTANVRQQVADRSNRLLRGRQGVTVE